MRLAAITLVVILAAAAALGLGRLWREPAAAALDAHLAAADGLATPQAVLALRSQAWILSGPGQSEGVAPFVALPDAEFGPERRIPGRDLAPTLELIASRIWDERSGCWRGPGGDLPVATVRERLEVVCRFPADAQVLVDLLTGLPAPETNDLVRLRRGEVPGEVQIRPFSGINGRLLPRPGRGGQGEVRPYSGCMLRFVAPGWSDGWRVARLAAVGF